MLTKHHRGLCFIVIALMICLIIGIIFHQSPSPAPKAPSTTPTAPAKAITNDSDPTLGNKAAPHHIVIFEDMKCSACKYYSNALYPQIKEHLIDPGKADYTPILLAFLPGSKPAGNAAYCVNEQSPTAFFAYIEHIYQHQPNEQLDWATRDALLNFAAEVPGINLDALGACIDKKTYYPKLERNLSTATRVMGDSIQTPTIVIDGKRLPMTRETFTDLLKQ